MSRLAIVTYDLRQPYNYDAANKVMQDAGFSRYLSGGGDADVQLTNTTWAKDVFNQNSVEARDSLAVLLQARFSAAGLNAKIFVVVFDDWAWGMRESTASQRSLYGSV